MIYLLASIIVATLAAAAPAAGAGTLSCPAVAPAEWSLPNAPLEEVRILAFPTDQPQAEDNALPIMAPVKEWSKAGVLYQTWTMNADAPRFAYKVDCLYHGTARHVRIDAREVKQCMAKFIDRKKLVSLSCK
ncbi:MAG: STY0301 family protein [Pseudomonadota bacterium]